VIITIRKKKPLCPITGEAFDAETGLKFKSLFASDTDCIYISDTDYIYISSDKNRRKPCYVVELFNTTAGYTMFAAVKIIDHRKLTPLDEALLQDLPINVVQQITEEYCTFLDIEFYDNYIVSMSNQFPIELDKVYSCKGIQHLLNEGILDLCISSRAIVHNPCDSYRICRLTEAAYYFPNSYEYLLWYGIPYEHRAYKDLYVIFTDRTEMLESRQKMIDAIHKRVELL